MFYFVVVEFFSLTADEGLRTEKSCTVVGVLCYGKLYRTQNNQICGWRLSHSRFLSMMYNYKCLKVMNYV